jgi:hypothetical protein
MILARDAISGVSEANAGYIIEMSIGCMRKLVKGCDVSLRLIL